MTETEKSAIKILKDLKKSFKQSSKYRTTYTLASGNEYTAEVMENILSIILTLIEKQQHIIGGKECVIDTQVHNEEVLMKEIEKKDKIINKMAEFLEDELTIDTFCTKENCYADEYVNGHCQKCLNCIIEYFTKKVEEEK